MTLAQMRQEILDDAEKKAEETAKEADAEREKILDDARAQKKHYWKGQRPTPRNGPTFFSWSTMPR